MRSPDPREEKLHQRGLSSVSRLWSNYTQKREDVGNQKNEENMINQFPSLKGVNRWTDQRILKIFLLGFRIQSDI